MDYFVLILGVIIGFFAGWYLRILWVGTVSVVRELIALGHRIVWPPQPVVPQPLKVLS